MRKILTSLLIAFGLVVVMVNVVSGEAMTDVVLTGVVEGALNVVLALVWRAARASCSVDWSASSM